MKKDYSILPIGLQLALETIIEPTWERIDPDRKVPSSPYLQKVNLFFVDVFTLAKDIIDGYEIKNDKLDAKIILEQLKKCIYELHEIPDLIGFIAFINTRPFLNLFSSFKQKQFKPGTKAHFKNKLLFKVMDIYKPLKGIRYINDIAGIPLLLYSHNNMFISKNLEVGKKIFVLESYTGLVLTRETLSKRFKPSKRYDINKIPFTYFNLLIFGDKYLFDGDTEILNILLDRFKDGKIKILTGDSKINSLIKNKKQTIRYKQT